MTQMYDLKKINDLNELNEIKAVWMAEIEGEDSDFIAYLEERIFLVCERTVERDDPADVWVLSSKEDGSPKALVELADATRGKDPSFKFLTLHIEPKYILQFVQEKDEMDRDDFKTLVGIMIGAIIESYRMAHFEHDKKLKILGKNNFLRELFPALILMNDPEESGLKFERHANWLVIDSN